MLEFNAASVTEQLQSVPHRSRAAFALACAVRLATWIPSTEPLAERARLLADQFIRGKSFKASEARKLLEQLDDSPNLDTDPVSSSYYALNCCVTGEAQQAFWAAQVAYDAVDSEAQRVLGIDGFSPAVEAQLKAHPVVQREFEQQARDLTELKAGADPVAIVRRAQSAA